MWDKRLDMIVHEQNPFNAEPTPAALARTPLTGADTFYSRNHGPVPDIDPHRWRLTVTGVGVSERTFSLAQLQQEFVEAAHVVTLQCAGNRRAGMAAVRDIPGEDPWRQCATSTARWTGISLADVLRSCRVDDDAAAHVEFSAPDVSEIASPPQRYGSSIDIAKALSPETMLAWLMNDEPIPPVHGGPVRVIVPGYIGARSVKWVTSVTVRDRPSDNYFQRVAYRVLPSDADPETAGPEDGISLSSIALNCDFLYPDPSRSIACGTVRVGGYAFAGDDRQVSRVEVSTDGGSTWWSAELDEPQGPWAWRFFSTDVRLRPPGIDIVARAWDTTAATQPATAAELWNPKGYVNNSWARLALRTERSP